MKKIFIILFVFFYFIESTSVQAQYFQGNFSLGTNDTLIFKIKPVGGSITTRIAYMEFAFRYETAQSSGLTVSAPVNNTNVFGSTLNMLRYPPDFLNSGKTYIKFVHNTGALNTMTFAAGAEYEVFKVKLSQAPTQSMNLELSSDLTIQQYNFAIINSGDQLYSSGTGDQLYGTGFYISGTGHFLPLLGVVAPSAPLVVSPLTLCQYAVASPLTANGSSLLWYTAATGGIGSSSAPIPVTTATGTTNYYVTQTINGIESPRALLAVNVVSAPQAPSVTNVNYCQNTTSNTLTATGDSLLWYTSNIGGTGATTAPTPNTNTVGTQQFYVSQTIGGCESPRATIVVTVQAQPPAPAADTAISYCQNATANPLSATGSSLLWYTQATGGTGNSAAPIPLTTVVGNNHYYVSQTVGGCESPRRDIVVTINALPAAPTVNSPVSYCLNVTAGPLVATGSNLAWYNQANGGTATSNAPVPATATLGTITYYVSQTQNNCESPRSPITVNVTDRINPSFNINTQVCNGGDAPVLPATSSNGINGNWAPSTISNIVSGNYVFTPSGAQCANIYNLAIIVNPNPYSNSRYPDVNAYSGVNNTLNATPLNGASYSWSPATGLNTTSIQSPVFNYNQQVEYLIHITSVDGCKFTDTLKVNVIAITQSNILVAEGFTPNGDGKNDLLIPNLKGIKKLLYFKVYDRWGQMVFQTYTEAKGWDGYFKGIKQPLDTYLWIAEGIDNQDKVIKKNGTSVLIR